MTDAPLDPLQQLLDIEAIKRLKARYYRFVDTKQWDDWIDLFTDDVSFEFSRGAKQGKPALLETARGSLTGSTSVHHGHMPEIEITSATTATGIWAMYDWVEHRAADGERYTLAGYGHYHEEYRKGESGWKIATMRLTRLRVDKVTTSSDNLR